MADGIVYYIFQVRDCTRFIFGVEVETGKGFQVNARTDRNAPKWDRGSQLLNLWSLEGHICRAVGQAAYGRTPDARSPGYKL